MYRSLATSLVLVLSLPAQGQSLSEALEQAWARHPQATAFAAREDEARARTEVASGITPGPASLSLSSLNDRLNRNRGKQEWEAEMAVPLWLPGQQAARAAEAESAVTEVAARRAALRLQVAGEVREAWWAVAAARNARDLARRRATTAGALEADVLRRFKAGDLARIDANLAQGERLAAEAEAIEAEAALLRVEQIYRNLTGAAAPSVLAAEAAVAAREPVGPHPQPPAGLLPAGKHEAPLSPLGRGAGGEGRGERSESLRDLPGLDHPQLAAVAAAARTARARLRVAEETRRDAPEFAVRVVRERGEFAEPYASTVGVKLTIPFSSGARVRQENAAARAEASQADAELALAQLRLQLDAEKTRLDLAAAERQFAMASARRELTADNLRLAEKAFSLGESDLTTLLRARAGAFEAEAFLNRQQVARAAAQSRLKQVLGVLP